MIWFRISDIITMIGSNMLQSVLWWDSRLSVMKDVVHGDVC